MSWGGGSGGRPELFTGSKLYISEKSLCWMKNFVIALKIVVIVL